MELPFPPPPKSPFKQLTSINFPVGARLYHYLKEKAKMNPPPEFKDNCDALDALRERLRNTGELPLDSIDQVTDYFHLLTTLLTGIDCTEQAAGLQFAWNHAVYYTIDFEICCMSYNLAIGLLNSCSRYTPKGDSLKTLVATIKMAKDLIDKCQQHFQEDFDRALHSSTIEDIQLFIKAIYFQAQTSVILTQPKLKKLIPGAAMLASISFSKTHPPTAAYARYYRLAAIMYDAEVSYSATKYGLAVCYTRKAKEDFPNAKELKKIEEPFKKLYPLMNEAFKPLGDKYEDDNANIFIEPIGDFDEIPACKETPIKGSVNWDNFITPCSPFETTINDSFEAKINSRLDNFKTEANRALKDIDDTLATLPQAASQAAHQKHEEMIRLRNEANNISQQVSTVLGIKSGAVSQRCPQIFQQFNQLKASLIKGSETDVHYETILAQCDSLSDGVNVKGSKLIECKDEINQILRQADIAAENARQSAGGGMTSVIEASQQMSAAFDQLANQMNPLFGKTLSLVREVKEDVPKANDQYLSQVNQAEHGFDLACQFYTKVIQSLNNIMTTINQC